MTSYLLDNSVLARVGQPSVASALLPYTGGLATCGSVLLEVGWTATSGAHYDRIMDDLGWYELLEIQQSTMDLALVL